MDQHTKKEIHNKYAPYWALSMFILAVAGVSTVYMDGGTFWKGYLLDMAGPAWNYILFRGLFTAYADNAWTRIFTPKRTFFIFVIVSYSIEMVQFFNLYKSTFDVWDLPAYIAILLPLFLIDVLQTGEK